MDKIEQIKQGIELIAKGLNFCQMDVLWMVINGTSNIQGTKDGQDILFSLIKNIPNKHRYVKNTDGKTLMSDGTKYYSAVGAWSVSYREIDGQLVIWEPTGVSSHLHLEPLYPATKEEYQKELDEYYKKQN